MTDRKNTKRALFASVISMLLCVTMLIGSTFAWFTDNASTAVNSIQAGNLDIQLLDEDGNDLEGSALNFVNANGETDVLIEPGATFRTNGFKVHQNGNLEFKFKFEINGIDGDAELLDVLEFSIVNEDGTVVDLEQEFHSIDFEGTWDVTYDPETGKNITTMIVGMDSDLMFLQVKMLESAGNEYQGKELKGIGITVLATQDTVEHDSNNNTYDADAQYGEDYAAGNTDPADVWDGIVGTLSDDLVIDDAAEFAAFAAAVNAGDDFAGKTVKLNANIDLNNQTWTSISSFAGTFDGEGHTVSNLKDAVLFTTVTGTVQNLNLKDVNVNASMGVSGMIRNANNGAIIDNCSVDGFTLTVTNTADSGDKVGALVGFASGADVKIMNSSVSNVTLNGVYKTKQWAGLVGSLQWATVENCTATNVKINVSDYYQSVGGFVGAVADGTIKNCDVNGVALNIGEGGNAGGFCGYTGQGNYYIFEDCHVTGLSITLNDDVTSGVGGFSGRGAFTTTIKNCSAEGVIDASDVAIATGNIKALVGQEYEGASVYEGNTTNVTVK